MVTNNSDNYSPVQYDVLVGAANGGIASVAPSATSGVPVISQGAAANPVFGTAVVAGGGTGATTLTGVLTGNGTSAVTASTITQYGTVVAGTSNAVSSIAPNATSGVPYISQGSSANPTFGTAVVAGGGTGIATTTAYAPICGGTTSTGAFQAATTGLSTSSYVLTSNGSSALPSFQAPSSNALIISIQLFTSTGTYTPTANMRYCIIECVGGGGGGGGSASATATTASVGGGGGGGGYARLRASSATIGASQSVTIGAAGSAGSAGNNAGGAGGDTSVGTICIGKGGSGGGGSSGSNGGNAGAGGVAGTGDFTFPGQPGQVGPYAIFAYDNPATSIGGASYFGYGGAAIFPGAANQTGVAAQNYGAGGGGGYSYSAGGAVAGGAGTKGVVVITEYIV